MKQYLKGPILRALNTIFYHEFLLNNPVILMYHSVGDNSIFFTVKPSEFRKQMEYLASNDFCVVSLYSLIEQIKTSSKVNKKTVVLTFDDGYYDNYTNVLPILREFEFPATIFVSTGFTGRKMNNSYNEPLPMLNSRQIEKMHESGLVDIEPHTVNHKRLPNFSIEEASREILESRVEIENRLNKRCGLFAYPYGKYSKNIISVLERERFSGAVTIREGVVSRKKQELFFLPRNSVDSSTNIVKFKTKLCMAIGAYHRAKKYMCGIKNNC